MKKICFFLVMLFAVNGVWGQATYTWNQTGTASWVTAANWTPARTTPATNDILQFNNAANTSVTNVPSETDGQLIVSGNTIVNLQAGAAATILTISGGTGTDLSVASGSQLNINGANTTTITLSTGATGSITGNMTFSGAAHKLDAADASGITFNSPSVFTQGASCTGNVFTATGTANAIVFGTGTSFIQIAGSNPFGLAAPNSKVVFQTGSLFKIQQNAAPSFSNRTYANLEISAAGFNQSAVGGNPLSIDNLTITTGTLNINLTGGISIKGNISVAASQTLTFTPASASTLTLNGTTPQSISGSGTLTFGPNLSLTINNASGITLNRPATLGISSVLTLTNGLVNTTATNLLTYTGPGAGGGGSAASHVNGPMARTGSTDYQFPIGDATLYRPISVSSLSGSATITASYTQANPKTIFGTVLAAGIDHIGVCEYWDLGGGSGVTGITGLQFGGSCNANPYVNDPSTLLVAHWNGSQWDNLGNDGTATLTSVKANTPSTFSPFTIGSSSNTTNPLPISLFSFSGYKDASLNQLHWTTASESNNRGFEVQRSTDGVNYTAIGFVNSQALGGNSISQLTYTFTDNNVSGSKQYYRLRQLDFDNHSKLSNILLIKGDKPVTLMIDGLFPNPAKTIVNVLIAAPGRDKVTLVVTDIAGRAVIQQIMSVETGSNTVPVDINLLANGTYMVKLICSSNCESAVGKFVKQ